MDPEGGDEMFFRTFPQLKLKVEDSDIHNDLEVQEIPNSDSTSDNYQDDREREKCLVISEEFSDAAFPRHGKINERRDPDEFFSCLPDELWIEILREFGPHELCVIGLTCRALLRLTRQDS